MPEVEEGDGADSSDWHKLARERKKKAGLFVCVGDLTVRLVAFSLVLEPAMNLLYSGLENAAQDFELLQRRRAASGKERTYRILEAAAGTLLKQCWSDVGKAMIHFPIELDTDYHTLRARSMLFRCFWIFVQRAGNCEGVSRNISNLGVQNSFGGSACSSSLPGTPLPPRCFCSSLL